MIKIESTATVNTIFPHANPRDRGTAPIAACTVAFGVYATMQKNRSFFDKFVFDTEIATPIIRNCNARIITQTAGIPAATAYRKFTVAPTKTKSNPNRKISATLVNIQNFPNRRNKKADNLCVINMQKSSASNAVSGSSPLGELHSHFQYTILQKNMQ